MATILPMGNPKAVGFYAALLPAVTDVGELTVSTAVQFGLDRGAAGAMVGAAGVVAARD